MDDKHEAMLFSGKAANKPQDLLGKILKVQPHVSEWDQTNGLWRCASKNTTSLICTHVGTQFCHVITQHYENPWLMSIKYILRKSFVLVWNTRLKLPQLLFSCTICLCRKKPACHGKHNNTSLHAQFPAQSRDPGLQVIQYRMNKFA